MSGWHITGTIAQVRAALREESRNVAVAEAALRYLADVPHGPTVGVLHLDGPSFRWVPALSD